MAAPTDATGKFGLLPHTSPSFLLKRTTRPNAEERWKTTVKYIEPNRALFIQGRQCKAHTNVTVNGSNVCHRETPYGSNRKPNNFCVLKGIN